MCWHAAISLLLYMAGSVLVSAVVPTSRQLEIGRSARALKVYIYDLAGAGLMPPLSALDRESKVCQAAECRNRMLYGTGVDFCQDAFGDAIDAPFATAYQVRP